MFFGFFLVFLILQISEGKPGVQNALVYLSQYGYLEPGSMNSSAQVNARTFKKSLEEFQAFTGLPVTGKLDDETLELMSMPRCGVKDKIGTSEQLENFVVQGSKWKTKNLNYRITKYSRHLNRATVDRTIQRAFNLWSKYTDLTFERTNNRRGHIEIRFEEGRHGDGDAFDGPGGTLAHAFFPEFGGTTHFDDSETWTIGGGRGTDLLQTAAHEFGHALGLQHSQIREALMAPTYKGYVPNLDLWQDDIRGIQRIYGPKRGGRPRGRPNIPPSNPGEPGVPEQPNEPPSNPDLPEPPSTPERPGFPDFPSFPSSPRFPFFPRFPSFPRFPGRPGFPSDPNPRYPSRPDRPSFPRFPSFPENPDEPPSDPNPEEPSFPQSPNEPPSNPNPEDPSGPGRPSFPEFPAFPRFPFSPRNPFFPNFPSFPRSRSFPRFQSNFPGL